MRLLVLGATGGVGRHVLTQALEAGHEVTVLARASSSLAPPAGVRVVRGEVSAGTGLDEAMPGQDAVLSSIGMQRRNPANPWSPSLSAQDLTSASARHIVAAMQRHGVRRVVAVSAAGVAESRAQLNLLMRFFLATTMIGTAYADLARMEATYAESGLDWLAPRPTRLVDGPVTGRVRVVPSFGLRDQVSRADVAAWMLAALAAPRWPAPEWGSHTPQLAGG
jgi:putative NADH-flavin reductase